MNIYLVGGAVRDRLLGLTIKERDWVVVGSTPEAMIAQGFQPVGKEFPVFLHPETHEEYALARTERKVSKGYKGFTFYASPHVSLAEDLKRRDLTINAIAQDADGKLIDPYQGQHDLTQRIFRHVSPAFQEDPVRILRLARFSSRFPEFSIHPETLTLMQKMVAAGEVNALVSERVWQELYRALCSAKPQHFFQVLAQCNALDILFPAIKCDGNGIKKLQQTDTQYSAAQRFAVLTHDIELAELRELNARYRLPTEFGELAKLLIQFGAALANIDNATPQHVLSILLKTDALRRPQRFNNLLATAALCYYPGKTQQRTQQLQQCLQAIKEIDTTDLQQQAISGKVFGEQLHQLRLSAVAAVISAGMC